MKSALSLLLFLGAFGLFTPNDVTFAFPIDEADPFAKEIQLYDAFFRNRIFIGLDFAFDKKKSYGRMMLSLTNSEIIFAGSDCENLFYDKLPCVDAGTCLFKSDTPVKIENPYFSAIGKPIDLQIRSLTPSYDSQKGLYLYLETPWHQRKDILLASQCDLDGSNISDRIFGYAMLGIIGMGTESSSGKKGFKIFSIDIEKKRLLFYFSPALAKPVPPLVFSANSSWQIPLNQGRLVFGNDSIPLSGNIIFDINVDNIILPLDVWTSLFKIFKTHCSYCFQTVSGGIMCPGVEKFSAFPPIRLFVSDNQVIDLPGEVLSSDYQPTEIFFSPSNTTQSNFPTQIYVRPLFKDSIVLGYQFLKFYYPVFKSSNGSNTIELYQRSNGTSPQKQPEVVDKPKLVEKSMEPIYYVFLVFVIFMALLCSCLFCKKSPKKVDSRVNLLSS